MDQPNTPGTPQSLAVHPRLSSAIDSAIAYLKSWARRDAQDWEALTDADALILKTLLQGSKGNGDLLFALPVLLSEFKKLSRDPLDARRWDKFLRWYAIEIAEALEAIWKERDEPLVYPARASTGSGGRGPKGQAIFFLSLEEPLLLRQAREARGAAIREALSAGQAEERQEPAQDAPHPADGEPESNSPSDTEAPATGKGGVDAGYARAASRPATSLEPLAVQTQVYAPAAWALSMSYAESRSSSTGWVMALALALALTAFGGTAGSPLADELIRLLDAAREVLTGGTVVRL